MAAANYPKFFITHSWRDNKFAKRLTDDLKGKGLHGFFDVYSIQPGDNIPSRISQGLEDCDVYIPILSEAAFTSPWCEWELGAAIQLRNTRGRMGRPRIIPVLIDHCADKVPAILRPIAYVDFSDNYPEGLKKLLIRGMGVGANRAAQRATSSARAAKRTTPTNAQKAPKQIAWLRDNPIVILAVVGVSVLLLMLGIFLVSGTPIPGVAGIELTMATPTKAPATAIAKLAEPITPTSVPTALPPTPSASIESPMCPEPQYTTVSFPTNGSAISGMVSVKGTVSVRPFAQPYRYSLYYRPDIVREAMDSIADGQAPLSAGSPSGKNQPIEVKYFLPFDAPMIDSVLGTWDTTKLTDGWYSLRLWSKDRGGNTSGCDVYVYVK